MKTISICIPVFNEEANIQITYNEIIKLFDKQLNKYDYEIVFTDNHSSDRTQDIITELCKQNNKVKYIRFRANLEYDKSILEGYKNSTGEAVIVFNCDLQDPPELLEKFIHHWELGSDVVYGVVNSRKENPVINLLRVYYYYIMNANTEIRYPLNAHDFRLVDRRVVNNFKDSDNLFPYVRGLTYSLAKNPHGVKYDRAKRNKGKSKIGVYKAFAYAINALIEETFIFTKIFRIITFFLLIAFLIFTIANAIKSFSILSFSNHLIVGLIVLICTFLTIICEYSTRIYFQLKKTERVIYEKKINFS